MSEEVAQGLDRARKLIVERGWWQHGLVGPNGEICAVQAIWAASGHELVLDALGRATGQYNIANWNDAPGRTRRQVLLAFRRAAKAERAESGHVLLALACLAYALAFTALCFVGILVGQALR